MASEQAAYCSSENMRASCQKRLICLVSTLHGIANCIKNGTIRKNVPPAYGSISPQCRPQLLSDRFENVIHNIFRSANSTLEINVRLFGVLHWQQLQPPASAPENRTQENIYDVAFRGIYLIAKS